MSFGDDTLDPTNAVDAARRRAMQTAENVLRTIEQDFAQPNFTDRHRDLPRIRHALRLLQDELNRE